VATIWSNKDPGTVTWLAGYVEKTGPVFVWITVKLLSSFS
jgi:hypothetical protein